MDTGPVESGELLRIAGRLARFGGWSIDVEEGLAHWSDEVCAIHEEPPGTTVSVDRAIRYYAPEWRPVIQERYERCIADGVPYDLELEILTARGRRRWVRVIGEPVVGTNGKVVRVQGAFQDISGWKEHEARARRIERKTADTLENLPDGFIILDREWRFRYLNRAAGEFFGRSRAELQGKVVWEEYPEAVEAGFAEQYERAVREDRTVRFEAYYEPWDTWFREHAYPLEDGLAVYFQDITGEQRVEKALERSEALFRQIAESIQSVFWLATPGDERIEYVSPAYATIWGRPLEELYENPRRWLDHVHPDDRRRVQEALPLQARGEYDVEFRILRPDGQVRWIWDRAFPIEDEEGKVYRVVGIAEDITERRRLEERLRHRQKMELVGQLAGGVAHDFNNLLTVIQATTEVLLEDLPSDSPLRKTALAIREQTRKGARLTRQLLAHSRRQVLQEEVIDLGETLREVEPMLRRVIPERIDLVTEVEEGAHRVEADPDQVQHVILNLVVNAGDAIEGHGRITLSVDTITLDSSEAATLTAAGGADAGESTAPGRYVRLAVRDTGAGMSAETRERVFEPFFTTKGPGKGSGLGLPMVHGIVRQSGGHTLVESEPGLGSTFRVLLPTSGGEPVAKKATEKTPSKRPARRCCTILVVEDDRAVRHATAQILRRLGHAPVEAANGEEALDVLGRRQGEIDLVLSDLVMPDMDGVALLEAVAREHPDLVVVLVSGYSTEELAAQAREKARAFIEKPFTPQDLDRVIGEAAEQRLDSTPES